MGAATKSTYSKRMSTPTSKKAIFVLRIAPNFCHIWFVCNNHLIFTRKGFLLHSLPSPPAGGSSSQSPSLHHDSPPTSTEPTNLVDVLYAQLQQAQKESKDSTKKLHKELKKRKDAEKEASEANFKVHAAEKDLAQIGEELRDTKTQLTKALDELFDASTKLKSSESQKVKCYLNVKEMDKKLESSENSQIMYKKLSDRLQEKLNDIAQEQPSLDVSIFSFEYSLLDLEEATNCFDPSLKIGKGRFSDVYRGFLNLTDVAIKILHPNSLQGPSEFKQEVDVLTKLRHPNLVTIIGTCIKSRGLIYEYLPNGTLQDRLICKDNTPPLPWQTRIQIATELCSVLNFLHSREPTSIIHADINPKNVLLDANFISKLSGFGFTGIRHITPKNDVYSFGIILMCLLTAKPLSGIVEKVKYALENDNLYNILDHSAGQWPFVKATQLAHLALRCCHKFSSDRPDLTLDVWMVLKQSNDPSRSLSNPLWLISEDRIPSYFMCPILQEIMQDPHFAADGFTYEASAIKAWFEGDHETSPMTNLRLANRHLTPNHALHSAIEEWQAKHQYVFC